MQVPLEISIDPYGPFAGKPAPTLDLCTPQIPCGSGGATIRLAREGAGTGSTDPRYLHFTDDGCALNPQNATIPATIDGIARERCR
ncbi:hypothetical protein E3W21_29895 [Pseudomonas sp. F01002]|nr:hypothetical protein E3W21_29895 [Pseudomonas sp. F01002]